MKKKVTVVSDASEAMESLKSGAGAFDFQDFASTLEGKTEIAPHAGRAVVSERSDSYTTSYQAKRSSIVAGMGADDLVVQHRKSLADISGDKQPASGQQMGDLFGVTLSRRHMMSNEEYDANVTAQNYKKLDVFAFEGTA